MTYIVELSWDVTEFAHEPNLPIKMIKRIIIELTFI